MKDLESFVRHLENAKEQDVKWVVDQVKDERSRQLNRTGSSPSLVQRKLGQVPTHIYWKVERMEPGFWNNKTKVREFFKLFKHYATAERI